MQELNIYLHATAQLTSPVETLKKVPLEL